MYICLLKRFIFILTRNYEHRKSDTSNKYQPDVSSFCSIVSQLFDDILLLNWSFGFVTSRDSSLFDDVVYEVVLAVFELEATAERFAKPCAASSSVLVKKKELI